MSIEYMETTAHESNTAAPYDTVAVTSELTGVLADTYRLVLETQHCHWNVSGPLFFSIHEMTKVHYNDMFAAADVLAERIRALGKPALIDPAHLARQPGDETLHPALTAIEMVKLLARDHKRLAQRLRSLVEISECAGDAVTADLASMRGAFHEKVSWMLDATAGK